MDEIPQFEGFPKIKRLFRDIIITEKIDGTNAQVHILEDGRVFAASRKRYLLPEQSDNHGFRAWVEAHASELRQLGPGRHYGEWWGKGINRGYGLDEKRFSLFNVSRWQSNFNSKYQLTEFEKGEEVEIERVYPPTCCGVVPIIYVGPFSEDIIRRKLYELEALGSIAALGFLQSEGIVIFHAQSNYLFKVTLENDGKPKGEHNGPATT